MSTKPPSSLERGAPSSPLAPAPPTVPRAASRIASSSWLRVSLTVSFGRRPAAAACPPETPTASIRPTGPWSRERRGLPRRPRRRPGPRPSEPRRRSAAPAAPAPGPRRPGRAGRTGGRPSAGTDRRPPARRSASESGDRFGFSRGAPGASLKNTGMGAVVLGSLHRRGHGVDEVALRRGGASGGDEHQDDEHSVSDERDEDGALDREGAADVLLQPGELRERAVRGQRRRRASGSVGSRAGRSRDAGDARCGDRSRDGSGRRGRSGPRDGGRLAARRAGRARGGSSDGGSLLGRPVQRQHRARGPGFLVGRDGRRGIGSRDSSRGVGSRRGGSSDGGSLLGRPVERQHRARGPGFLVGRDRRPGRFGLRRGSGRLARSPSMLWKIWGESPFLEARLSSGRLSASASERPKNQRRRDPIETSVLRSLPKGALSSGSDTQLSLWRLRPPFVPNTLPPAGILSIVDFAMV